MRKLRVVFGALSVAVAAASAGCGSGVGEQAANGTGGSATGGGTAGTNNPVAGSAGHESGGSAMASAGMSQGGGAAGSTQNLYVDELRVLNPDEGCLPRPLPFGKAGGPYEGRLSCYIGELRFTTCDCTQPGRAPLSAQLLELMKTRAKQGQTCGAASGIDCAAACGCEIVQLPGTSTDIASDLYACQNDVTRPTNLDGFCGVDQDHLEGETPAPIGNAAIVANCPTNSHRRIRFTGNGLPSHDAYTYLACAGSSLANP